RARAFALGAPLDRHQRHRDLDAELPRAVVAVHRVLLALDELLVDPLGDLRRKRAILGPELLIAPPERVRIDHRIVAHCCSASSSLASRRTSRDANENTY